MMIITFQRSKQLAKGLKALKVENEAVEVKKEPSEGKVELMKPLVSLL